MLSLRGQFGRGVLQGIQEYASLRPDWQLVVVDAAEVLPTATLHGYGLAGLLVHTMGPAQLEAAQALGRPFVNVSNRDFGPDIPTVTSDDRQVGVLAAEALLARGYRRLAFLGQLRKRSFAQRCEGFLAAVQAAGAEGSEFWVEADGPVAFYDRDEQVRLEQWLDRQGKPLAVLAASDRFGTFLIDFALERGWRVPEDLAILGVDNDHTKCQAVGVALSSVELGLSMIGYRAAKLLADWLGGVSAEGVRIEIPPVRVVERASTEHFAVEDVTVAKELVRVEEHLAELPNVEAVAAWLHVSRRTLERRWGAALGASPLEELSRLRLRRAQRWLRETDLTCLEVARAVGLPDNRSLTVLFRRLLDTTPTAFRRQG